MISIVTPSLEQVQWLRLCIASVADQERVRVEHIVQDGGTREISQNILPEGPGKHDYNLQLYVEKDAGMYDAVNRGLARASGDVCAYLNCDEQYLPGVLHEIMNYFGRNPAVDVLFGDAILVNEDGNPLAYRRAILPSLSHLRLADLNTLTCATFFRRRLVDAGFRFPTHLRIAGDQHWVFHLLKAGIKMGVMRQPLSVFTFTGANLSNSRWAEKEKFGWLPSSETPNRWMTPAIVSWHRVKKLFAGAYRRRDLTIEIYTRASPDRRCMISASGIGFRWPKS